MRTFPTRLGLATAAASFLTLVIAVTVAISEPERKPVAGIKNIMSAVNHEKVGFYGMIKTWLATNPPSSDGENWKLMRDRAQVMAECGNILMDKSPPRGADDEAGKAKWMQHCADYRDTTKKFGKALAYKKVPKATAALEAVTAKCDACHKDHKSE